MHFEVERQIPAVSRGSGDAKTIAKKNLADLRWRLSWESGAAKHQEEYLGRLNVWRDLDLLPRPLAQQFSGLQAGSRVAARFEAGELFPAVDAGKVQLYPLSSFAAGKRLPRAGRYYPRNLLAGNSDNFLPFRCVQVEGGNFTGDFNHPLAGQPLRLEVVVQDVLTKTGDTGGECQDWLDLLTTGPGMQSRWQGKPTDFWSEEPFQRDDDKEDAQFYTQPRLVSHIDRRAQETISELYRTLLRPGMTVLDLMSSWQSHLPAGLELAGVTGLGLNEAELQANPRLNGYVVHDLNAEPRLPLADQSFDAIICTVSVEYLTQPQVVCREALRVLRPGGLLAVSFSNRWFPPKVTRVWTELYEYERLGLVLEYFLGAGGFTGLRSFSSRGWPRPEDDRYFPQVRFSDPVYAAWGWRE